MMERAGYLQQTRLLAYDSEGVAHDIVELRISWEPVCHAAI